MRCPTGVRVTGIPGKGNYTGTLLSCQVTRGKAPGKKHAPHRGDELGVPVWHVLLPAVHLLTQCAPADMDGIHVLVKFLKLPTPLSSRPDLVYHGCHHSATISVPSIALDDVMTHKKAPTLSSPKP